MTFNTISKSLQQRISVQTVIIDILALGVILLVPTLSHLTGFPLYFVEPMRIILVLALLFSSRFNAFALAIMLPLFSFLVSGYPAPVKMAIIMVELSLNAWIYLAMVRFTGKPFISMFSAILLSKFFCYYMYWMVFSWAFVIQEAQPVFLISQTTVTLILSAVSAVILSRKQVDSSQKL